MADPKNTLNPVTVHFTDTGPTTSQSVPVTAANPLPVTIAAGGADADINVAGAGGVTVTAAAPLPVTISSSTATTAGIAPVVSTALETGHVIKNAAGNLYGLDVVTTTAAGYVLIFDSTTVPAAGAVTPIDFAYVGAFGSVGMAWNPPLKCSTGISVAFSASTTPFTKVDSATAAISGQAV